MFMHWHCRARMRQVLSSEDRQGNLVVQLHDAEHQLALNLGQGIEPDRQVWAGGKLAALHLTFGELQHRILGFMHYAWFACQDSSSASSQNFGGTWTDTS